MSDNAALHVYCIVTSQVCLIKPSHYHTGKVMKLRLCVYVVNDNYFMLRKVGMKIGKPICLLNQIV